MSLLELERVSYSYPDNGYEALSDISVRLEEGESVGIVGESGSGKSTLAEIIGGLVRPTKGRALYEGRDIAALRGGDWRRFRHSVQYIFQDPKASINPYFSLRHALTEPMRIAHPGMARAEREERIVAMLHRLGLDEDILAHRVGSVSGGQAQRIVIARALLMESRVIVADECVSALDLSIAAQIMNILSHIRRELGTGFLFISHDMALVRWFCSRIYVMLHGRIVECVDSDALPEGARSDYTRLLLEDSDA